MNILFRHLLWLISTKNVHLFFCFVIVVRAHSNWKTNRKQQKHRWNFMKPYRVHMRWDRPRRISKSTRLEHAFVKIFKRALSRLNPIWKNRKTVQRLDGLNSEETCRNNKSSLRRFFFSPPSVSRKKKRRDIQETLRKFSFVYFIKVLCAIILVPRDNTVDLCPAGAPLIGFQVG